MNLIRREEVIEAAARLLLEQMGKRAMASLESQIVKKPRKAKKKVEPVIGPIKSLELRHKRKYTKRSTYWKKKKKA